MLQKTSPRGPLKRTLIVLGAAALVQPAGSVTGLAQTPKKEDNKQPSATSGTASGTKGKGLEAAIRLLERGEPGSRGANGEAAGNSG